MVSPQFYYSRESSLPSAPPVCTYLSRAAAQSGLDGTPLIHRRPRCFLGRKRPTCEHVIFSATVRPNTGLNCTDTYMVDFVDLFVFNNYDFHYLHYLMGAALVMVAAGERMRGMMVPLVGWWWWLCCLLLRLLWVLIEPS